MSASYVESETLLDRALNVIPLGAQTFSKSITQLPRGVSPFFATRAKGQKVWDADGNAYVDFVNALAAITIGHADPEITAAAERQMQNGTIFSLSHPPEAEVAERPEWSAAARSRCSALMPPMI